MIGTSPKFSKQPVTLLMRRTDRCTDGICVRMTRGGVGTGDVVNVVDLGLVKNRRVAIIASNRSRRGTTRNVGAFFTGMWWRWSNG